MGRLRVANGEIRTLLLIARRAGWVVHENGSGHYEIHEFVGGPKLCSVPKTPSDYRGIKNSRSILKAALESRGRSLENPEGKRQRGQSPLLAAEATPIPANAKIDWARFAAALNLDLDASDTTDSALARAVGVTSQSIANWRYGRTTPRFMNHLYAVMTFFGWADFYGSLEEESTEAAEPLRIDTAEPTPAVASPAELSSPFVRMMDVLVEMQAQYRALLADNERLEAEIAHLRRGRLSIAN